MPRTAVTDTQYRAEPIARAFTLTSNVTYSGSQQLDVYRPAGLSGRPAIVLLHGGGWQGGSKTAADVVATCQAFVALGFVVFSADYRLVTPGNRTATQRQPPIDDTLAAVSWVRSNAATYGVDSTKVAVLGLSAGGHLGLMAGCTGVAAGSRPDAVVAWSAPTRLENLTGQGLTPYAEDYIGNTVPTGAEWDTFSPYYQITSGCCPIRVVNSASENTATGGIAQAQADDMHTAAVAVSVDSTKRIITGPVHADFRSVDVDGSATWLAARLKWPRATTRTSAGTRVTAAGRVAA